MPSREEKDALYKKIENAKDKATELLTASPFSEELETLVEELSGILGGAKALLDASVVAEEEVASTTEEVRDPPTIMSFFKQVADGAVAAQKGLDLESENYLKDLAPAALPSVFRLPKVSAEFQFGIENSSTSGFNIFIASSKSVEQEKMQQKISFDIISAPPPPNYVLETSSTAIGYPYVGTLAERATILDILRTLSERQDWVETKKEKIKTLIGQKNWGHVLIFRQIEGWVLIDGLEGDDPLNARIINLPQDGNDIVISKGSAATNRLKGFFTTVAAAQAEALVASRQS